MNAVWAMVHKLCKTMGQRDDFYILKGMIEADEGYFTIEASEQAHKTQKSGHGSKTKANVMIMAESTVLEDLETGKVGRQAGYFKAKVLVDHKMENTDRTLKQAIENDESIVFTD